MRFIKEQQGTGALFPLIVKCRKWSELRIRSTSMRSSSAFLFLAAVLLGTIACSPAHAYDRRICLIGGGYDYPGDCAYDTYAQCKAAASGQQAYCDTNPRYLFGVA